MIQYTAMTTVLFFVYSNKYICANRIEGARRYADRHEFPPWRKPEGRELHVLGPQHQGSAPSGERRGAKMRLNKIER